MLISRRDVKGRDMKRFKAGIDCRPLHLIVFNSTTETVPLLTKLSNLSQFSMLNLWRDVKRFKVGIDYTPLQSLIRSNSTTETDPLLTKLSNLSQFPMLNSRTDVKLCKSGMDCRLGPLVYNQVSNRCTTTKDIRGNTS
ncbi:unnamed protein product [Prunus brigantina]